MIEDKFEIGVAEKKEYPVIPVDVYNVELVDATGEQTETYDSKKDKSTEPEFETVYKFEFKFLDGVDDKGKTLVGTKITKKFVPNYFWISAKGKNLLYQITEAFKGSALTEEEVKMFNVSVLNSYIGKQIRVGIEHKTTPKGIYCNINTFYASKFEPTSTKEADTTNPDDHHLNAEKKAPGKDIPVIDVDDDDGSINLEDIPF